MADMPSKRMLASFEAAADDDALVKVLRGYKNQIIGNKHKKVEFQAEGIIPAVIGEAMKHRAHAVWHQVSAILYSMAAGGGKEAAEAIEAAEGPALLLQMLAAEGKESEPVILGAARALTALFDYSVVSVAPLSWPETSQLMTRLAAHSHLEIARYIMYLSGLVCLRAASPAPSTGPAAASALMSALTQQLPRCIYSDPAARTGTAPPRFMPLRTTALATMDILLNQHDAPFTQAAVPCLPDVAAAVKFPDAETRLAACSIIATVLHPPRIAAARRAPEWPQVRAVLHEQLIGRIGDGSGEGEETKMETDAPLQVVDLTAVVGAEEGRQREEQVRKALEALCLSVLVKLQSAPSARPRIPYRLFGIICNSDALQRAVADSDALENLISFIIEEAECNSWKPTAKAGSGDSSTAGASTSKAAAASSAAAPLGVGWAQRGAAGLAVRYGSPPLQLLCALLCVERLCGTAKASPPARSALASPCLQTARAAIADAQCVRNCAAAATAANLNAFAKCLQHPLPTVRTASAMVLRVIGRCSEATAKECFGDQQLAATLVNTLDDTDTSVRAALCFAICNLCATASCPARQQLLDKGVVGKLAAITVAAQGQQTPHLPTASIYALSNTVSNATTALREDLMGQLPWPQVRSMLSERSTPVATSAWSLMQNMSHSSDVVAVQRSVLQWSQKELLTLLHDVIKAELVDKSEGEGAPSTEGAALGLTTSADAPPASPPSVHGARDADEDDPNGPAPMVTQDIDSMIVEALAGGGGGAAEGQAACGHGGIRGTSADVPRDHRDPSMNIQGELRELSDIAGLRSPMGGLLADPVRLLEYCMQSQSWWVAGTRAAGEPGSSKGVGGGPRSAAHGSAGAQGHGDVRDADGGQDVGKLKRQRQVLISALYTANNLATGGDDVKNDLLAGGLHDLIPAGLRFSCADDAATFEVHKVSCWLATNLVHVESGPEPPEGGPSPGLAAARERAQRLGRAGVFSAMQEALRRPGQPGKAELGPRLRTAIAKLQSLLGHDLEAFS